MGSPRKKKDNSPGIKIELEGRTYVVHQSDLTPRDAAAIRRETGFAGFTGLMTESQRGFDMDCVAALVWLARRVEGERDLAYDDVLDSLSYGDDFEITTLDERVIDGPEA